jgi:hypothetical protein
MGRNQVDRAGVTRAADRVGLVLGGGTAGSSLALRRPLCCRRTRSDALYSQARNSQARCWIEGVIQPGGERVVTSDRDVAIKRFIRPGDGTRNEPLPEEIEGQRLTVSYWPRHAEVKRWWHPPTVVSPGEIPGGGMAVRNVLIGVALVGLALFFFRRGFRYLKVAIPAEPR